MDADTVVREYYRAIDDHDYGAFADLLAPKVVHRRPDRTIEGRETLVAFMRDERPDAETGHEVTRVFEDATPDDGDAAVAVRGRLRDAAGEQLFEFVDVFSVENERIAEIETFTR
jgi:ketosteroid isomerase-like protein